MSNYIVAKLRIDQLVFIKCLFRNPIFKMPAQFLWPMSCSYAVMPQSLLRSPLMFLEISSSGPPNPIKIKRNTKIF